MHWTCLDTNHKQHRMVYLSGKAAATYGVVLPLFHQFDIDVFRRNINIESQQIPT